MATENIESKTLALEIDTAYVRYMVDWIDMSHLARVFSCNFAFIFNLQMYKEAVTGPGFVVDRIFFGLLRPEDIQYCHSWTLKTFPA